MLNGLLTYHRKDVFEITQFTGFFTLFIYSELVFGLLLVLGVLFGPCTSTGLSDRLFAGLIVASVFYGILVIYYVIWAAIINMC